MTSTAGRSAPHEPSLDELTVALSRHVDRNGSVLAGLADEFVREYGWCGRVVEVLRVFTENEKRMAFLAGGRRPDEIVAWLSPWVESSLTIDEIGSVIECGGLYPDPFAVLAGAGLLQSFLRTPEGGQRRIQGELAGGWLVTSTRSPMTLRSSKWSAPRSEGMRSRAANHERARGR